jgi:hypothetical protein
MKIHPLGTKILLALFAFARFGQPIFCNKCPSPLQFINDQLILAVVTPTFLKVIIRDRDN